jgi:Uncharacterised nucleotidyltransferase
VSVLEEQTNLLRLRQLNFKVHEYRIEKAWKRFENAGFKPILIKGWAAAQYYDNPFDREFNDIDLVIEPKDFDRAELFQNSYHEDNTAIDLHRGLRQLDTLSFDELYNCSQIVKCGQTEVRVLCREDHLRVLCVHWLIDGGAKKEKLEDIYYAVKNRPPEFRWDRCLNVVSQTRRKWILCTIALAGKYLGLDLKDTPLADEIVEIPGWLLKALEKEWRSDVLLLPIHYYLNNRRELWRQLKKRIPPNPIQATIDMEGEFDNRTRIFYQTGDIFFRLKPSVKRIAKRLFSRK